MKRIPKWKNKTAKKEYLEALIQSTKTEAITYEKNRGHELGEFIEHFKFGLGFVQKVISQTKIEVFFEGSERILLQNWQK